MNLLELSRRPAPWRRVRGPFSDVVVSSRVRLARNLAGMPFLTKCTERQMQDIVELLRATLLTEILPEDAFYVDISSADPLDKDLLVERHLISRQHADGKGPRGVVITTDESVAVMVNEEDHLRCLLYTSPSPRD